MGALASEFVVPIVGILLLGCLVLAGLLFRMKARLEEASRAGARMAERYDDAELAEMLIDNSPDGIVVVDEAINIVKVNEAYCRMTGRSKDERIGLRASLPGWNSAARGEIEQRLAKALHGESSPFEATIGKKDGGRIPALFSPGEMRTERGSRYHFAIVKDISELKRAESALQASEARLKAHFDSLPIPVYTWKKRGDDFELVDGNTAAFEITEGGIGDLLGAKVGEVHKDAPDIVDDMWTCYRERRPLRRTLVYPFRTPKKTKHLVVSYAYVPPDTVLVHTQDVTDRAETEEMLRESEARLRTAVDSIPFDLFMLDREERYVMVNAALREHWGGDVIGKRPCDFDVDQETLALWESNNRRAFAGEVVTGEVAFEVGGQERFYHNIVSPVRDGPDIRGVLGVNVDITARKRSEKALALSEEKFRKAFHLSPDGMVLVAADDRRFVEVSRGFERIFGYTRDEAVGRTSIELGLWRDLEARARFYSSLTAGQTVQGIEMLYRTKSGEEGTAEASASAIVDVGGKRYYLGIIRDITDRKRAEKEIARSREQLRALAGRLHEVREEESSSIAREIHDELGQALAVLKWEFSGIGRKLGETLSAVETARLKTRVGEMTRQIDATIDTVKRISSQLRPIILDSLGLVGAIEWHAAEFQNRTGIRCEFRRSGTETGALTLDPQRSTAAYRILQEILTNVLRHAEARRVWIDLRREDDVAVLDVRDDGRGMPVDAAVQRGGLGIVGMRERAQVFGGRVSIRSEPGTGTHVRVDIPISPGS